MRELTPTMRWTARLLLLASGSLILSSGGCVIGAAVGGMAESYRRTGTTEIPAEYTGLRGRSFAVVVNTDRSIESAEPGIAARLNTRINERIALNAGASHGIPSTRLLSVLYNKPQWPAMPPSDVAKLLGVERLVWVELFEYRLNEPGNQYIWDGLAAGQVYVYESDSALADEPIFERAIQVGFPDSSGFLRSDLPGAAVTSELSNRFVNRIGWLFYDHEESNVIPY